jgi:Flp pilus assembly protein TadG
MTMHVTLASKLKSALRRLRGFGRRTDGAVTVEFVVWIPVLLIILAFTADACQLYLIQADLWNVARDAARRMSILQLAATPTDTVTPYIKGQLLYYNSNYTITPSTTTTCSTSHVQTINDVVSISVPVKYASVFGVLAAWGGFSNATLNAQVIMLEEDSGSSC